MMIWTSWRCVDLEWPLAISEEQWMIIEESTTLGKLENSDTGHMLTKCLSQWNWSTMFGLER